MMGRTLNKVTPEMAGWATCMDGVITVEEKKATYGANCIDLHLCKLMFYHCHQMYKLTTTETNSGP